MQTVKVPLFSEVYRNVDGEELNDKSYELVDGYVDELGYTVKRPGLRELLDLGVGTNFAVEGIFWWPQKNCALAVSNGTVYRLAYSSGTLSASNITNTGPGTTSPPVFCVGVDSNVSAPVHYGLVAAGGRIAYGSGTGTTIANFGLIADADAPTTVSHIDFIDGYVLATTGKTFFQYSDVNAPTSWAAASFASAMRNPDNIKALKVFKRQIFLIGDVSTEVWENDGQSPFAPVPGGFIEEGTAAPHSLVQDTDALYWLNHERRFVAASSANVITRISTPYDNEIDGFSSVTDCKGDRVKIRGKTFLVFQFPTVARTLVYSTTEKTWSEWRYWNNTYGEYEHFVGKCFCYCPGWGLHLVGSRKESVIYGMSPDHKDDADNTIRFKKVTGHIDYGTLRRKRSRELRVRLKRGEGLASGEPQLMIRWRDDNRDWSNEQQMTLGNIGETTIVGRIRPRGVYRTRQYEIVVTDAVSVSMGEAEEDIEVLSS